MKKTILGIVVVIAIFVAILTAFLLLFKQNYNLFEKWNMTNPVTNKTVITDFLLTFEKSLMGNFEVSGSMTLDDKEYTAVETSGYKNDIVKVSFFNSGNSETGEIIGFFDKNLKFAAIYFEDGKATFAGPTNKVEAAEELSSRIF